VPSGTAKAKAFTTEDAEFTEGWANGSGRRSAVPFILCDLCVLCGE